MPHEGVLRPLTPGTCDLPFCRVSEQSTMMRRAFSLVELVRSAGRRWFGIEAPAFTPSCSGLRPTDLHGRIRNALTHVSVGTAPVLLLINPCEVWSSSVRRVHPCTRDDRRPVVDFFSSLRAGIRLRIHAERLSDDGMFVSRNSRHSVAGYRNTVVIQ